MQNLAVDAQKGQTVTLSETFKSPQVSVQKGLALVIDTFAVYANAGHVLTYSIFIFVLFSYVYLESYCK